jgi:hypothetical protein
MNKYYKAEMDRLLRISTRVVTGVFIILPLGLVFGFYKALHAPAACPGRFGNSLLILWMILVLALTALTAYVARAMAPKGYALNDVELLIDRDMKPIKIPLKEILGVSALEDGLLRSSLRLMGTSGYYGYYGLFWNRKLGRYRAYVTRTKDLLAVKTEKGLYVLSPDDTKDFAAALSQLLRK